MSRFFNDEMCGCCGRALTGEDRDFSLWCADCRGHVRDSSFAPWDRTYFATTGEPCPFDIDRDPDDDPVAMAMKEAV